MGGGVGVLVFLSWFVRGFLDFLIVLIFNY